MEDKKISVQLGIGTSSIFMMFVIVVMCVISVLSYLNASSYYESTIKQANITESYYKAQSEGLEIYYQLENDMKDKEIKEILKNNDYEINKDMIEYHCDMNDKQYILFEVNRNDLSLLTIRQCNKGE